MAHRCATLQFWITTSNSYEQHELKREGVLRNSEQLWRQIEIQHSICYGKF